MSLKFKLTSESKINNSGIKLFRIEATVDIKARGVKKGDKGGWVESEENVFGNAWIFGDAQVFGDARVYGDAQVFGDARVYGDARVFNDAWIFGDAQVFGDARVYGDARVSYKKAYTKGLFISTDDCELPKKLTVLDYSREEDFDNDRDYKNLYVLGDFEAKDIDPDEPSTAETIEIGGKIYKATDELKPALKELKEV